MTDLSSPDPAGQKNDAKPSGDLAAKVNLAEQILGKIVSDEQCVQVTRFYVGLAKEGQPVTPLAWESVRTGVNLMPKSTEGEQVLKVVEMFLPQGATNFAAFEFKVEKGGLSEHFIECLQIFQGAIKMATQVYGIVVGENFIKDGFDTAVLVEHLKEKRKLFLDLNAKIVIPDQSPERSNLEALKTLIHGQVKLQGYLIDYLGASEKSDKLTLAKVLLHIDLADESYNRALAKPDLPERFRSQLIGATGSIPELRIPTLSQLGLIQGAKFLSTGYINLLEIMRDFGDMISGTGFATKYQELSATLSLSATDVVKIIQQRNQALRTLVKSQSAQSNDPILTQISNLVIETGELYIQFNNVIDRDKKNQITAALNEKTRQLASPLKSSPKYVQDFLRLCCRNKVPVSPML